jgi:hypothetical protein
MVQQTSVGLAAVGLLLSSPAVRADTALVEVTPQTIRGGTFRLTSKPGPDHTVRFVIRRDIRRVSGPGERGYLSHPAAAPKSLGTPLKLERDGHALTFRFSVPEEQLADSVFTLWGNGLVGEGVTYRFRLAEFWKSSRK